MVCILVNMKIFEICFKIFKIFFLKNWNVSFLDLNVDSNMMIQNFLYCLLNNINELGLKIQLDQLDQSLIIKDMYFNSYNKKRKDSV